MYYDNPDNGDIIVFPILLALFLTIPVLSNLSIAYRQ